MTNFDSAWLKLDRTKQHIDNLEAEIAAYLRTNPYPVVTEDDPQRGKRIAKVGDEVAPIPSIIPLILGDAVHAIRSSLDHFAYAANANPPDVTRVAFPIWSRDDVPTLEKFQAMAKGQMPTASQQLLQAVCALQSYRGGNGEHLWLINRLDVIDKHRLLVTAIGSYEAVGFDAAARLRGLADWTKHLPVTMLYLRPAVRYPLEPGTELFIADPASFEKHEKLQFAFNVAFGEPQVVEGQPVVPTLRGLLDEVKGLLERLIPLAQHLFQ
jgi:hypothetical protein